MFLDVEGEFDDVSASDWKREEISSVSIGSGESEKRPEREERKSSSPSSFEVLFDPLELEFGYGDEYELWKPLDIGS